MEINFDRENQPQTKDVSTEFLTMSSEEFRTFLKNNKTEPSISITINWVDVQTARKLKAFLEDSNALGKQKRSASIKATQEQMKQEPNVFSSGVTWIETK
ncbi:MAG: hypothetical protein PHQ18_02845 [Patescibacteria group bacterium]|nr:hypothetical protein [Patescibacteria group bacterium]